MHEATMNWYRLEPVDAWFFRDSRPSNRGEDQSDLESQFPPHASTVVGALRAALAREQGWNGRGSWDTKLNETLGNGFDDLGKLSFQGPFIECDQQRLFPMPTHVLGRVDRAEKTFKPLDWLTPSAEPVTSDLGDVYLPVRLGLYDKPKEEREPEPTVEFFVTATGMTSILQGELPSSSNCLHRGALFAMEGRIGIEREEKSMYSPRYVRLKPNVRLVVGIAGVPDDWSLPSYFPLGGESRLAVCDKIEAKDIPTLPTGNSGNVVVAATPALFPDQLWYGAAPGEDASLLAPQVSGKVKTAAFDRPLRIGGWDTRNHKPLALQPYVQAGSVWWLDEPCSIDQPLQLGEQTRYGFGLAFIGK